MVASSTILGPMTEKLQRAQACPAQSGQAKALVTLLQCLAMRGRTWWPPAITGQAGHAKSDTELQR